MMSSMPLSRALQDGEQKEQGQDSRVDVIFNM
jgi:hypothetical protein